MASSDHGLTTDDREQLTLILDANQAHGDSPSDRITAETCAEWRDRHAAGERITRIVEDYDRAWSTISRHVNGRCSHD